MSTADIRENLAKEALSHEKRGLSTPPELVIPRLSDWVMQQSQQSIHILGTINHHTKYRLGSRIKTSKIFCFQKVEGRNIISTRNSIYELGDPAIPLQGSRETSYQHLQQKLRETQSDLWNFDQDPSDLTGLA